METKLTRRWLRPCLAAILVPLGTAGCWDPVVGPAIQNGFAQRVVVNATYEDGRTMRLEMDPAQVIWQRPPSKAITEIRIVSTQGATLLVLNESDIRATGISAEKKMLVVSDDGARAIDPPP